MHSGYRLVGIVKGLEVGGTVPVLVGQPGWAQDRQETGGRGGKGFFLV